MGGIDTTHILALASIIFVAGVMSGLTGFGFSAIGAATLLFLPPTLAVPLLFSLSITIQVLTQAMIREDMPPLSQWWPDGPAPYMLGGLAGAPMGVWVLHNLPSTTLKLVVGGLLALYAVYSLWKPASFKVRSGGGYRSAVAVGIAGGTIGGFTAFPGAAVVVWMGLRGVQKVASRAVVQPFILGMQILSLVTISVFYPKTFGAHFWPLLAVTIPAAVPGALVGVLLYRRINDMGYRRVTFAMLGISGLGLLINALAH